MDAYGKKDPSNHPGCSSKQAQPVRLASLAWMVSLTIHGTGICWLLGWFEDVSYRYIIYGWSGFGLFQIHSSLKLVTLRWISAAWPILYQINWSKEIMPLFFGGTLRLVMVDLQKDTNHLPPLHPFSIHSVFGTCLTSPNLGCQNNSNLSFLRAANVRDVKGIESTWGLWAPWFMCQCLLLIFCLILQSVSVSSFCGAWRRPASSYIHDITDITLYTYIYIYNITLRILAPSIAGSRTPWRPIKKIWAGTTHAERSGSSWFYP